MTAMALYARFLESFVIVHGNGELPEEDWVFFSSFLPIEGPLLIKIKCLKDMGNDFFRQNLFESAGGCYDMACRLLCYTLKTMDDFDIESVVELAIYLNLNLAACANKLQEYEAAKKCCSLVLSSFPKNAKALFRRALAFMKTNMLLEAQSDLEIASMLEPKNKDILREMKVVKNLRSINPNGKRSIDDHLLLEVVRDSKRPIPVLENIGDNFVEDDGGSSGCYSVSSPPDSITKDTCNSYDGLVKNPKDKFSPNMDLDQHCKEYQESASIKMFQFSKKGGGSSVLRIDARNLGAMPIIIIPAICNQPGSPFGAADVCNKYGLAYASLSMAIGTIYIWLYVYNIVRISSNKEAETTTANGCGIDKQPGGATVVNIPASERLSSSDFTETATVDVVERLPSTHQSAAGSIDHFSSSNKFMVTIAFKIRQGFRNTCKNINLKAVLAPATIAAAVGFFIGMIPPLRKLIFGKNAPLRVVGDTTFMIGDATIPLITLILGANLLNGLKGSRVKLTIIVGIIVVRYIILPLLGILVLKGAVRAGFVQSHELLLQFVILLQYALPPALTIGTQEFLHNVP
ncbi:hypothetical protein KSS87_015897 [Heliosperma pusillum]|nr:hypothetical protein KSS87_015897 [Heliosperma pusillum]